MIGTSSGALVIDRWMPASTHAATLHRAMRMLMQPEQGTRITCAVDIDSLIDFYTEELDTGRSVDQIHQLLLVRNCKLWLSHQ